MTTYIESKIKEIKEEMTLEAVKEYFNEKCYLTNKEFGEVINEFIIQPNHDILKIIVSSKKFKEHNDCLNEYDEPVIHAIIYAIQAVYESDEISDDIKMRFKTSLLNILNGENHLNWNLTDCNVDNPLHVILSISNYFTNDELLKLIDTSLAHGINPLNKNCLNQNAIDVVLETCNNNTQKELIVTKLAMASDKFLIEVQSSAYSN